MIKAFKKKYATRDYFDFKLEIPKTKLSRHFHSFIKWVLFHLQENSESLGTWCIVAKGKI